MNKKTCLLSVAFAALFSSYTNAAIVSQMGDDVVFTYDDSTLFGSGIVVGNTINFNPVNFRAEVIPGFGVDNATDTLNIDITVKNGSTFSLDKIVTTENGDYSLFGSGSFVSASLFTQVDSNNVAGAQNTELVQTGNITAPQDGSTNLWNLSNMNDWDWEGETSITFTIQNNLTALAGDQEFAWIQKKDASIGIDVQVVPLPAAAWFMLSALTGLFVSRKVLR